MALSTKNGPIDVIDVNVCIIRNSSCFVLNAIWVHPCILHLNQTTVDCGTNLKEFTAKEIEHLFFTKMFKMMCTYVSFKILVSIAWSKPKFDSTHLPLPTQVLFLTVLLFFFFSNYSMIAPSIGAPTVYHFSWLTSYYFTCLVQNKQRMTEL